MLLPETDASTLTDRTIDFIDQINKSIAIACNEIQIDCDWTLASRDKYMDFVTQLKHKSNKKLSATIRLHQIKYFKKTGVPLVDYGVLMYCNMGHIAADSMNSIYDRKTGQGYLKNLEDYPLRLEVALPVFSWAIHIRRQKVMGVAGKR